MGLARECQVVSCYEAGREGFWLHRFLTAHGIENLVVDSSSIEVSRRRRRAKTDRLDGESLLDLLLRHRAGSRKKVWSVVRVPTVEQEDRRHLHRELQSAKRDRTRLTNRIKGLLANHGLRLDLKRDVSAQLAALRQWDGSALPPGLRARLAREWERVRVCTTLIERLEAERRELLRQGDDPTLEKVRQLNLLRGIGTNSAWLYALELFGWREFRNRRQVGAIVGLVPTPHDSGQAEREQGMSKAGNRHVRAMAIEIAWGWLRFQPESVLSKWYQRRFGSGSKRVRKIGIVALARKLIIELWRFLETGVVPEGAQLKTDVRVR
jgi:transposase